MRGPMIETEAHKIYSQSKTETRKENALRMLRAGKLTVEEIAEYTGLEIEEVEQIV